MIKKFSGTGFLVIFASILLQNFALALTPEHLQTLEKLADDTVSYSEIRPGFVEVAKKESTTELKTTRQVVAELQAVDIDYATRIARDEDFFKLSYLLDQGWDLTKKNSEGHDLLIVVLAQRHIASIDLVLKSGGYKIVVDRDNDELLAEAGRGDDFYLRGKLKDWESAKKRKELLFGDTDNYNYDGTTQRQKRMEVGPNVQMAPALPGAAAEQQWTPVEVPYATNRTTDEKYANKINTYDGAAKYYSYTNAGTLSYGIAYVTIPKTHKSGEENDLSFWETTPNPAKNIILNRLTTFKKESDFFNDLGKRAKDREAAVAQDPKATAQQKENAKDLFVYIHGFNVDYAYAMKKTAQMIYDMDYRGTPIAFSWPARAVKLTLPSDFQSDAGKAEDSVLVLELFLTKLRNENPGRKIHIIAHSLGTRVLSQALLGFARRASAAQLAQGAQKFFGEVVLAAPAIDAKTFAKEWAPQISKVCDKISIISSDDDVALKVESLAENDDFSFPLGLWSATKAVLPAGYFNFDASDLTSGTFSLDHSVYSQVKVAIDHIAYLLEAQPKEEADIPLVTTQGIPYLSKSARFDFFDLGAEARNFWKFLK